MSVAPIKYSNYLSVSWEITQACNLNCKFCGIRELHEENVYSNMKILNPEQIILLAKKINDITTKQVCIFWTGGEPFLEWDKLYNCASYFKNIYGFYQGITTNGTLILPEWDEHVLSIFNRIMFSVDGPEELHDNLRCSTGCYKKVISVIKRIIHHRDTMKSKNKIVIGVVLTKNLLPFLDNFIYDMLYYGADEIEFRPMQTNRSSKVYSEYGLKKDDFNYFDIFERIQNKYKKHIYMPDIYIDKINKWIDLQKMESEPCWVGENYLFIDIYGNIHPCCSMFPKNANSLIPYNAIENIIKQNNLRDALRNIRITNYFVCEQCIDLGRVKLLDALK